MSTTSIQLHYSGDAFFARALAAIEEARKEVLIESYIFNLDPIGLRFLRALKAAVARGVEVKVLVDGIGSFNWAPSLAHECRDCGIPLRVYHPLPFVDTPRLSWRSLRRWLKLFRRINQRNHRKVILVDERVAFLGSMNVSQVHTVEFMEDAVWRDTGVEIEFTADDTEVRLLRAAFLNTWKKSQANRTRIYPLRSLRRIQRMLPVDSRFRLNSRAWWRYLLLKDLLRRMRTARTRILITNAYFIPRRSILVALRRAARRGVYVGLVLPQKTDVWIVREASRSLYYRLLKDGVRIFEYQPSILHAKTLIIDDWATVGSHNLNHRSLMHDLEVETVLSEPELVRDLTQKWDDDVRHSRQITSAELGRFPFYRRWLSRVIYWFRYWL